MAPKLRATLAERKAAIYRGRVALYQKAVGWVLLALLYRLLAYNALVYAKGRFLPPAAIQYLAQAHQLLGWAQLVVCLPPLFSEKFIKARPGMLLLALALVSGTMAALGTRTVGPDGELQAQGSQATDSAFSFTMVTGLSPNDVYQVSVDTQPTVFVALPVAVGAALFLPVAGSHLTVPLLAAALPYVVTKVHLALAGWEQVSLVANIGSVLSGGISFAGAYWLLSTLWKFTSGRSLVNYDIDLRDPLRGQDPQDATFLAAWAFHSYLIMPLWLLVFGVRTWLWVLSCGVAFSRPPLPVKMLQDD